MSSEGTTKGVRRMTWPQVDWTMRRRAMKVPRVEIKRRVSSVPVTRRRFGTHVLRDLVHHAPSEWSLRDGKWEPLPGPSGLFRKDFQVYHAHVGTPAGVETSCDCKTRAIRVPPGAPCFCRPGFPPQGACKTATEASELGEEEEERGGYSRILLKWIVLSFLFVIFFLLWMVLFYAFIAKGGYVNIVPQRIILSEDLNTYIDMEDKGYKLLIINNSAKSLDLEVHIKGPFSYQWGGAPGHFNYQFERYWYEKTKFKNSDVERDKASSVEVDHSSWSKSYSKSITSTYRTTISRNQSWISTSRSFTVSTLYITVCLLTRAEMTRLKITKPYNFVSWREKEYFRLMHAFPDYTRVPGRLLSHRNLGNKTDDNDVTVIYALRYCLNFTQFRRTEEKQTVAFAIKIESGEDPQLTTTTTTPPPPVTVEKSTGKKYAFLVIGLAALLMFLQTDRSLAIFTIGMACLSVAAYLKVRPDERTIIGYMWLDFMMVLFYYMLLVATTMDTGFYDVFAVGLAKVTRGKIPFFLAFLWGGTAVLSMFMNNTIAILLMTPIAIRSCEVMKVKPQYVLMAMIIYCNIGGLINIKYNIPSIMLAKDWQATKGVFPKDTYFETMLPTVLIAATVTSLYCFILFRFWKLHRYKEPYEIAVLKHEQYLWKRAMGTINRSSQYWWMIRSEMYAKHQELEEKKNGILSGDSGSSRISWDDTINTAEEEAKVNRIRHYMILSKVVLVMLVQYILNFMAKRDIWNLGSATDAWVAFTCSGFLLLLLNPPDLNPLLWRVVWTAFFSIMALCFFGHVLEMLKFHDNLLEHVRKGATLSYYVDVCLGVSATLSALISNMAITPVMIHIVDHFTKFVPEANQLSGASIAWAMIVGENIGGSATVVGSGPAIVCAASALLQGYELGGCRCVLFALPVTVLNLIALNVYWLLAVKP